MVLLLHSTSRRGSYSKHYKSFYLSLFPLCQSWILIIMFNSIFKLGMEEDILSSFLKYDMGERNSDSSFNDKCECSTYRTDNTGILSTGACGTATSKSIQPLLAIVREHLPIKCLECILKGFLSAICSKRLNTLLSKKKKKRSQMHL